MEVGEGDSSGDQERKSFLMVILSGVIRTSFFPYIETLNIREGGMGVKTISAPGQGPPCLL